MRAKNSVSASCRGVPWAPGFSPGRSIDDDDRPFRFPQAGQDQDAAKKRQTELKRQHSLLTEKKAELLRMRLSRQIEQDQYAQVDTELRDQLASMRLQLEASDAGADEDAAFAVRCFELSQNLRDKWLTADFAAKRKILSVVALNYRMEGRTLVVQKRSPFSLLGKTAISVDGGGAGNRTRVRAGTCDASTCVGDECGSRARCRPSPANPARQSDESYWG
jgi:hypothetical protein